MSAVLMALCLSVSFKSHPKRVSAAINPELVTTFWFRILKGNASVIFPMFRFKSLLVAKVYVQVPMYCESLMSVYLGTCSHRECTGRCIVPYLRPVYATCAVHNRRFQIPNMILDLAMPVIAASRLSSSGSIRSGTTDSVRVPSMAGVELED